MGQNNQILDFKEWHYHEFHQSALIQVISQTGFVIISLIYRFQIAHLLTFSTKYIVTN